MVLDDDRYEEPVARDLPEAFIVADVHVWEIEIKERVASFIWTYTAYPSIPPTRWWSASTTPPAQLRSLPARFSYFARAHSEQNLPLVRRWGRELLHVKANYRCECCEARRAFWKCSPKRGANHLLAGAYISDDVYSVAHAHTMLPRVWSDSIIYFTEAIADTSFSTLLW